MSKFLHITYRGAKNVDDLTPTFNKALDWYRYTPDCWIVWTTSSPQEWYSRLKQHLEKGDNLYICELNVANRQGWTPKSFWEWLRKERFMGESRNNFSDEKAKLRAESYHSRLAGGGQEGSLSR
jgi:hypothetical protein